MFTVSKPITARRHRPKVGTLFLDEAKGMLRFPVSSREFSAEALAEVGTLGYKVKAFEIAHEVLCTLSMSGRARPGEEMSDADIFIECVNASASERRDICAVAAMGGCPMSTELNNRKSSALPKTSSTYLHKWLNGNAKFNNWHDAEIPGPEIRAILEMLAIQTSGRLLNGQVLKREIANGLLGLAEVPGFSRPFIRELYNADDILLQAKANALLTNDALALREIHSHFGSVFRVPDQVGLEWNSWSSCGVNIPALQNVMFANMGLRRNGMSAAQSIPVFSK